MISKTCGTAIILLVTLTVPVVPTLADGASTNVGLTGTNWRLVELPDFSLSDIVASTLVFSADSVGGNGGCNGFGGELTMDSTTIDISQIISTQMACDGLPQEQAYFAALEAAVGYSQVGGDLILTDADGATLARLAPEQE